MKVKIRDWTFTHWWVRPVVKVWFSLYHKTVTYSGTDHVDWNRPIIFAPTHQNAFSDALCLILPARYTNKRFIYPLIRADAFGQNRFIDWILTTFHMIPVYRPRDNVDLKKTNEWVFTQCRRILSKNRNLLIHPEGNCIAEKRVRRCKKGLARIALRTETSGDGSLGLQIVPVGINYRSITEPRKGIHVRYGAPIEVSDYLLQYEEHKPRALNELTDEIQKRMTELAVHIDMKQNYGLANDIIRLAARMDSNGNAGKPYSFNDVNYDRQLAIRIKRFLRQNPDGAGQLKHRFDRLKKLLKQYRLKPDQPIFDRASASSLFMEGVLYLLLLPVFLYGWFNNVIPWKITEGITGMIREKQFISSARMILGLVLFPLCYLLQGVVFYLLTGSWAWTLSYIITLPISGIAALNYWEKFKIWQQKVRLKQVENESKDSFESIKRLAREILAPFQPVNTERSVSDTVEAKEL